jgi:tetratricopeptide (TPR) repeat protein
MRIAQSIVAALLGGLLVGTALPAPGEPSVEEWTRKVREASPDERKQAVTALTAIAAGEPSDPKTREATFALAELALDGTGPDRVDASADALAAAVAFYPEDPRIADLSHRLARLQLDRGDTYGAHLSFRQWLERSPQAAEAASIARAAANAAAAGDMAAAFDWSGRVDAQALSPEEAVWLHKARLESGLAVKRHDAALEAARELIDHHAEALRLDARTLLACARTFEAVGLLTDAARHYETFVNLHPRAEEHPQALLALGQILARTGRPAAAVRTWHWLAGTHPASGEATDARLALLEVDGSPPDPADADAYLDALAEASDLSAARRVCNRLGERFIGAGLPFELVAALSAVARHDDGGIAPFAAKVCLNDALVAALELLASREDFVGVALVAGQVEPLGLTVPTSARTLIDDARRRLGLCETPAGPLEEAIALARRQVRKGEWGAIVEQLGTARLIATDAHPVSAGQAGVLLAEALWRTDRPQEALASLDAASRIAAGPATDRRLRVLRADILFDTGRREEACAEYRAAAELAGTRWVRAQLERCAVPQAVEVSS